MGLEPTTSWLLWQVSGGAKLGGSIFPGRVGQTKLYATSVDLNKSSWAQLQPSTCRMISTLQDGQFRRKIRPLRKQIRFSLLEVIWIYEKHIFFCVSGKIMILLGPL
jgi:hypothetical protein